MASLVLGVFTNVLNAKNVVLELERKGYTPSHIPIITKEDGKEKIVVEEQGLKDIFEIALSGMFLGSSIGAIVGLLVSLGPLPALNFLLIGEPVARSLGIVNGMLANILSGAITGFLVGGILGAILAFINSQERSALLEDSEALGLVVVPVRVTEEGEARLIIEEFGADSVRRVDWTQTQRELEQESYREDEHIPAFYHDLKSDEDWDKLKKKPRS
ncbi:hypothetical protein HYW42_03635 [Candidatus Daviesbacteria bacterium]|nr:hypothetical protein [Candidatus Daviesbacteria bacterium]